MLFQSKEKGERSVHSLSRASCSWGVPPQRCDGERPICSTCTRSRLQANCTYEDPSPESSQGPSSPTGSTVATRIQDGAPDKPVEASDLIKIGESPPPIRGNAPIVQVPLPMSLKDFRPLLFSDYEDPLLFALSDISLEDMNMSLWVPLLFDHRKCSKQSPAVSYSLLTEYNLASTSPRPNNKPSSGGIPQAL